MFGSLYVYLRLYPFTNHFPPLYFLNSKFLTGLVKISFSLSRHSPMMTQPPGWIFKYTGWGIDFQMGKAGDSFQSAVLSGQSSVFSPQSSVRSFQSAVLSRQSSVGSPQPSVGSRQSSVGSSQWAVGSFQSAVRSLQSAVLCMPFA